MHVIAPHGQPLARAHFGAPPSALTQQRLHTRHLIRIRIVPTDNCETQAGLHYDLNDTDTEGAVRNT